MDNKLKQKNYYTLEECLEEGVVFPTVTIHGRFQPPIHRNHFDTYVKNAFQIAEHVKILITNPRLNETTQLEAAHRNRQENNPFTYDERVSIFTALFENLRIDKVRYSFAPFDITDVNSWDSVLDKEIPNLVNTYSPWSYKKLENFQLKGYPVVRSSLPKVTPVSGTRIRTILFSSETTENKKKELVAEGLLAEAVGPLFEIYKNKI